MITRAVLTRVGVALCLLWGLHGCRGPELVVGELLHDADTADANPDANSDASDGASPIACTSDLMCGGEESHCNLATGRCVECITPDHCIGDEHPLCQVDRGECVDCLTNTDCPDNLFCQLPEGECEDTP